MPLVSVVVIGYNDAAHLPTALRSVQRQAMSDLEILVVDDASTDDMPEVARRFADNDPRIRVLRLDQNSGGCSRPRNVGVEAALGRYVMFLDSDDELPRQAAARLVAAAERGTADLACGRWVRRHHHPRRTISAHDELYARSRVITSITDEPKLLYDTPAWNKLYRRSLITDNNLRFPEGLLYEDLLFTTEAYCAAARIALVPALVYVWHVRKQAAALSITNTGDLRIWRDRFEVHRRIDAFLADHAAGPDLLAAKQGKFVDADFLLFLRDLRQAKPMDRPALFDLAIAYVGGAPDLQQHARSQPLVTALDATARGDLDQTLDAADRVVADGNGPFGVVQKLAVDDQRQVAVEGIVRDVTSPSSDVATARLDLVGRLGGRLATVPATVTSTDNGAHFTAGFDLARVGRKVLSPRTGPEARLVLSLQSSAGPVPVPLTARDADLPTDDLVAATPWKAVTGDRLRFVERNGRFVALLAALPSRTDRVIELAGQARDFVHRRRLRLRQASRSESAS